MPKPRRSTDHLSGQPANAPLSQFPKPAIARRSSRPEIRHCRLVRPIRSKPLVSVGRAAPLLGISVKTLRDWILYRRIDYVKIGTRVMIRPETIRELVDRNTRRADIA